MQNYCKCGKKLDIGYDKCFECFKKDWYDVKNDIQKEPTTGVQTLMFNEPTHYHLHDMDTITFLQQGFSPDVFMSFAIGSIIKYAQRAKYKNGREDYVKMVDYAKRALDWYDQTTEKAEK